MAESSEEFAELTKRALLDGEKIPSRRGVYACWQPGSGIEIWIHLNWHAKILGFHPHVTGSALMRLGLFRLSRARNDSLSGMLHGWADPKGDSPERGALFSGEVPNFDLIGDRLTTGKIVDLQIAAFALEEVRVFAGEDEAYAAGREVFGGSGSEETPPITWAVEHFVPGTVFEVANRLAGKEAPSKGLNDRRAWAMLGGRIVETELRRNPVTQRSFYVLGVKTVGGEMNIIADPALISTAPLVGHLLRGSFWLSARVVSGLADTDQTSFMSRLVDRLRTHRV